MECKHIFIENTFAKILKPIFANIKTLDTSPAAQFTQQNGCLT